MFELKEYLADKRRMVEAELAARMPAAGERPGRLHAAMRYAVLNGGKRVRPVLCMAAAEAAGAACATAIVSALALELLHTYTLIHDDLPCMDNDDLRRGKPTVHKAYDEATALLAGDALLTLAFEWLAGSQAPAPYPPNQLSLELARAAGSTGVIGGQAEDIANTGKPPSPEIVEYIHVHKTGALIRAAVRMGAISAGADARELDALTSYGTDIGLAFQIADDILNETSTPGQIGKPAGSDKAHGKITWVAVHGLAASKNEAAGRVKSALAALNPLRGNTGPLAALAHYIVERNT